MKIVPFKTGALSVFVCSLLHSYTCIAEDYFDPSLLDGQQGKNIDLSVFDKQGGQTAGTYATAIYLNQNYVTEQQVHYNNIANTGRLAPAFTKATYIDLGIMSNATPAFSAIPDNDVIPDISAVIPDAYTKYTFELNKLDISIPQIYIRKTIKNSVPEKEWDDGINALFTNYSYSGASTKDKTKSSIAQSSYLNLRSGVNWQAWRLRNYSTYSHANHMESWKNLSTYLQRDIKSLKSQLTVGDSYSPADMFDSIAFRGVQLASDDAMVPNSIRGFAPIVRGTAQSNAQITIRQNGSIIWQSYVPPGPFAIDDLYPTASSGDLQVEVKEADGSVRTFIQPFSSVPIMLREGRFKFSLTAGEYRNNNGEKYSPEFMQATAIVGLPYTSTLFGGTILSKKYNAGLIGIGKSLGEIGSVSFDTTIANAKLGNDNSTGTSFRFQYAKEIQPTGTSFSLAGYRYSTSRYRDFAEANGFYAHQYQHPDTKDDQDALAKGYSLWRSTHNKRDKIQLNLNQSLGDYGNLYLMAYQQQYWNVKGKEQSINLGYNTNYHGVTYSFNYAYSKDMYYSNKNQVFSLSVQIPLSTARNNAWINLSNSTDNKGNSVSSAGISGTALDDNSLQYNLQQGYANRGQHATGNLSANYRTGFGEYQAGYNYSSNTSQLNYSANGSVILHRHGATLGQPLGDTAGLIHAKDAKNLSVTSQVGVRTDRFGNAVVPYLSPYQRNVLTLDASTANKNVDLVTTTKTAVPTRGAIVMLDYPAQIGLKIHVKLTGKTIPFGALAQVVNGDFTAEGIVDDRNTVYLSGVPSQGNIDIRWNGGQCHAPYNLGDTQKEVNIKSVTAACR